MAEAYRELVQMREHKVYQRRYQMMICRMIRDVKDPFFASEELFRRNFRLSQDLCKYLIRIVRPHFKARCGSDALPLEIRVLCALSFYATGTYQRPVGRAWDFAVAQSSVCLYIEELTTALNHPYVACRFIKFPECRDDVIACMERNRNLGGRMPRVLGYIDGSLIRMKKTSVANNIQAHIGRKGESCMNVQFVCDRRMYIMGVLARFPGATTDAYIFHMSAVRRKLIALNALESCCLLGDSGYPLEPWIMVPFARGDEPLPDSPESRFNKAHCHDRNVIERCIGLLKEVFRALNNERVLHYHPVKVCRLTVAISVLHNLRILARIPNDFDVAQVRNRHVNNDFAGVDEDAEYLHVLQRGRAVRQEVVQFLEDRRNLA